MSIRAGRLLVPVLASLLLVPSLPAQRRPPGTLSIAPFGSPAGVTVAYNRAGVQLTWQGVAGAAQYQIHRGPDEKSLGQLVALPPDQTSFLDQGFNAPAVYVVVAVSARGATGPSAPVAYSPPVAIAGTVPTGVARGNFGTTRSMTTGMTTGVAPVITSLQQPAGARFARNGQSVVVAGTGLDGLTGVALVETWYYKGGFNSQNIYVAEGWYVHANAPAHPVTPTGGTAGGFSFVPQVPTPPNLMQSLPYKVIVSKGGWVDTSDVPIDIAGALPVRKITGVAKRVIRSGGRVDVTGVGLDQASAGYFGTGAKGSGTNPMMNLWNRGATGLQIATLPTCDQEGFVELDQVPLPGEPAFIVASPPVTVVCVPETPSGTVVGSNPPTGYLLVMPGQKITIQGKYLKYVTRVLTNAQVPLPFTYAKAGNTEMLSVTLPSPTQPIAMSFFLENVLTDPVVPGTVTGGVQFMAPATFNGIQPAWAEAGQLVRLTGHNIKYTNPIQVTVGGVAAQVVSADATSTTFRLGAGTMAGPIEIQNEAGKAAMTGQFAVAGGNHPGFFVVSGPSVVTHLDVPQPLGPGSIITVHGQNLARLGGICLPSAGSMGMAPGPVVLKRLEIHGPGSLHTIGSNTVMQVKLEWPPSVLAAGPIGLRAPTQAPGDQVISAFGCAANGAAVNWP